VPRTMSCDGGSEKLRRRGRHAASPGMTYTIIHDQNPTRCDQGSQGPRIRAASCEAERTTILLGLRIGAKGKPKLRQSNRSRYNGARGEDLCQ
jgi:hypothetical protein